MILWEFTGFLEKLFFWEFFRWFAYVGLDAVHFGGKGLLEAFQTVENGLFAETSVTIKSVLFGSS